MLTRRISSRFLTSRRFAQAKSEVPGKKSAAPNVPSSGPNVFGLAMGTVIGTLGCLFYSTYKYENDKDFNLYMNSLYGDVPGLLSPFRKVLISAGAITEKNAVSKTVKEDSNAKAAEKSKLETSAVISMDLPEPKKASADLEEVVDILNNSELVEEEEVDTLKKELSEKNERSEMLKADTSSSFAPAVVAEKTTEESITSERCSVVEKSADNNLEDVLVTEMLKDVNEKAEGKEEVKIEEKDSVKVVEAMAAEIIGTSSLVNTQQLKPAGSVSAFEEMYTNDLDQLTEEQLKNRVKRLSVELYDYIKWERAFMKETINKIEEEERQKYESMLLKLKSETEASLDRQFLHKELDIQKQHEQRLTDALLKQTEFYNNIMKEQINKNTSQITEEMREQYNQELQRLVDTYNNNLAQLHQDIFRVKQLNGKILESLDKKYEHGIEVKNNHKVSALIALVQKSLSTSKPLLLEIKKLKEMSTHDELLTAIIDSIPKTALSSGTPTVADLRDRLNIAEEEVRKAVLAPDAAPPMLGQMIGSILAYISLKPQGLVQGDNAEAILARAKYYITHDDLHAAVNEIRSVKGYASTLLKDWSEAAEQRLVVDQAISALQTASTVRHFKYAR